MGEAESKMMTDVGTKASTTQDPDFSFEFRSNGLPQADRPSMKPKSFSSSNFLTEQSRLSFMNSPVPHYSEGRRSLLSQHVLVKTADSNYEKIAFSPGDHLTIGWLYSEYYRIVMSSKTQLPGKSLELQKLILVTEDGDLGLDYLLTDYSETLDQLPDGIRLAPMTSKYSINGSITLKDILPIKSIGIGGFSKVFLIRRKDNGQFYALKFVSKKDLKKSGKEEYAFNEKKLLAKLKHKFINRFQFSFQTPSFLCFGLEYCPGGCLYDILKKHKTFDEEVVRSCIAQVSLALSYLHKKRCYI